ncbi:MAG TPA: DUF1080 domain-containing protein [Pirellulaceae bacterium]|nr:DUF1080 domain-containing protein [Pirellulaceae bacterium]
MRVRSIRRPFASFAACALAVALLPSLGAFAEENEIPKTPPTGDEPGWVAIGEADLVDVNGNEETWTFPEPGLIKTTGLPVGVIRTKEKYEDVEILVEWRHLKAGGNSGVFVWASEEALKDLPPGKLPPGGIEVQILDHGYAEQYEKSQGKKPDWFTTNGDVFPVGSSKMKPFPPTSPSGERSFPKKNLSKGTPEWNRYYVRCKDGEVRLWVNGEEVSGGAECEPSSGYICLEAEGAPVEFRNLKFRRME